MQKLCTKIEGMFRDATPDNSIMLSSIHKAKGLEADVVHLLQIEGNKCPHPLAATDWAMEQELSLIHI